ncbi:hypothetical protein KOI35_17140 [Actinoplanes bogorensis]|uniref:Secreted protein n=1 Tax=Paractinoplanes bogorensis TaxID=1610840 RepID=A0ABS5YP51_9ACTN|nr:hypothetical protein [Actinoplanes bogorensis]MBU2665231.1 hypothetical protein [Actinoplanes bogorensis]
MRRTRWIGSVSAAVLVAAGLTVGGPAPAAQAADWGGCSAWVSGKYATGRCANVNRKWRVIAHCKWLPNVYSEWITQRGGDVTTETRTPCDFGTRSASVEERAL